MEFAGSLPSADVIAFDPVFFATPRTITLASPLPNIPVSGGNLEIQGPGIANLKIDGAGQFRVFNSAAPNLVLSNFEVTGGMAANGLGGGLLATGIVTVDHMLVRREYRNGRGSLIRLRRWRGDRQPAWQSTALLITDSTISGNTASNNGGGIFFRYGGTLRDGEQHRLRQLDADDLLQSQVTRLPILSGGGFPRRDSKRHCPLGLHGRATSSEIAPITNNTSTGSGGGIGGNGLAAIY